VKGDSEYLASILDGIDGELVLVGHSYGGIMIANAAADNDRVKALVFRRGLRARGRRERRGANVDLIREAAAGR
jgi:pimeloyl-ACP methyl ester carboxylesterase